MNSLKSKRGTFLLVAMVLSASVAVVLLSYTRVPIQALRQANRSLYANATMDLVDAGIDQAMWVMNYDNKNWTDTTSGFSAKSIYINGVSTAGYEKTITYATSHFGNGIQGAVKVWATSSGTAPMVIAQATVTLNDGTTYTKEAEAYVSPSSLNTGDITTKGPITISGGANLDAWNSDPTGAAAGSYTPVQYSASVAVDKANIGSTSTTLTTDITNSGGSVVNGGAAVGDASGGITDNGSGSTIGPYGTTPGTITNVTYDYTTNIPDQTAPTQTSTGASTAFTTLPSSGTVSLPADPTNDTHVTDSTGKTTYYYSTDAITLGNGKHDINGLTISNQGGSTNQGYNIVIVLTSTGTSVKADGGSTVTINQNSTLAIYSPGNMDFTGGSVANSYTSGSSTIISPPANFYIYGTESTAAAASGNQTIKLNGGSTLSAVVNAPNASVTLNGGGQMLGAITANDVTVSGGTNMHYDLSLNKSGNSGFVQLAKYRELYAASDRIAL
jgi:hypothetical protein